MNKVKSYLAVDPLSFPSSWEHTSGVSARRNITGQKNHPWDTALLMEHGGLFAPYWTTIKRYCATVTDCQNRHESAHVIRTGKYNI